MTSERLRFSSTVESRATRHWLALGVSLLGLSVGAAFGQGYKHEILVETGALSGITSIDARVSINDRGTVAFVGTDAEGGKVWTIDFAGVPRPIRGATTRSLGGAAINNLIPAEVGTRERVSGTNFYAMKWAEQDAPFFGTTVGQSSSSPVGFNSLSFYVDVNDNGVMTFPALIEGSTNSALYAGVLSPPLRLKRFTGTSVQLRPQMANDNHIVIRDDTGAIVLVPYPNPDDTSEMIAGAAQSFTLATIGAYPGISADGTTVAFVGDKGMGPGVFVSVPFGLGREIHHIAGETDDLDGDQVLDFSAIDGAQRAAVISVGTPSISTRQSLTVVFGATMNGSRGIYAVRTELSKGPNGNLLVENSAPLPVLRIGDPITGDPIVGRTVANVVLYDAPNSGGAVALWVTFDSGTAAVLRSRPLSYAALGDSYSSGQGADKYIEGTDDRGTNVCRRSQNAYAFKITYPGVGPVFPQEFVACSGAKATNVLRGGAPPEAARSPAGLFSEGTQLDKTYPAPHGLTHIVDVHTDLATISIGGNDVGFEPILEFCVGGYSNNEHCHLQQAPWLPMDPRPLIQVIPQQIRDSACKAKEVYASIKQWAPGAAIFVMGYPRLIDPARGSSCPFLDSRLDGYERGWMSDLVRDFNAELELQAAVVGVHFVPVITIDAYGNTSGPFRFHEACGQDPWIHGIKLEVFNSFNRSSSFHPTIRGQQGYADALSAFLRAKRVAGSPLLMTGLPANPDPLPLTTCSGAPDSGLPSLGELRVDPETAPSCDSGGTFVPGQAVRIRGTGFGAGAAVTVRLRTDVDPVDFASVVADVQGILDTVVTIPLDAPTTGAALLEALGYGANGAALLVLKRIGLSTSFASDLDGDSVPDPCDNCPAVSSPNALDADGDGLGDVCDNCPGDVENDVDQDGSCSDVDPCPWDAANDGDGDGRCESRDNCPALANADQRDSDADAVGDLCDAAPMNPGVFAVPGEVENLAFEADHVTYSWASAQSGAGPATVHDVLRGLVATLPVGTNDTCLVSGTANTSASDPDVPSLGSGHWYLVRGRNILGAGTYGSESNGLQRSSAVCP